MPLKALALELYRAQQKVHKLEEELADAPPLEKDQLKQKLQGALLERDQLRRLVDAKKQDLPFRTTFKRS